MSKFLRRTKWAGASLTLVLMIGSLARAEDVELLLSNPASSNAAKPNILFILDTSGSMKSIEKSQEPFDGTQTYSGPCNRNYLYWTTSGGTPSCSRAATSN